MKKLIGVLSLFAIVACQQNKIAFVDNVQMMESYEEKTDVENKYQAKLENMTKRRDSISQAFQMQFQAFQAQSQGMPEAKAQEQYQQIQQRGQMIGQQLQQEEQAMQLEGQAVMDSLIKKVKGEISAYGKANGYTFILGGGEGGSVLYGEEAKDLTDEIVKILNDKYKQ